MTKSFRTVSSFSFLLHGASGCLGLFLDEQFVMLIWVSEEETNALMVILDCVCVQKELENPREGRGGVDGRDEGRTQTETEYK